MADVNAGQYADFPAVPTHGGQFVQYNIFGNMFEITAKYRPPIMPIGRGAYGIVWYLLFLTFDSISLISSFSCLELFLFRSIDFFFVRMVNFWI